VTYGIVLLKLETYIIL